MFGLVDVNAFFASCETIFRPDLRDRPVVVLSNNDGCIVARSAAARRLGLKTGMPWYQVREQAEKQGCVAFSSNYELYQDFSHRFITVLSHMVPRVEQYSIDEAFCDLGGMSRYDLEALGHEIRRQIQRRVHLTVGIGIAPTRTLAKLANHAAKQWSQTGGVVDLRDRSRQLKLMKLLPVSEVWGVGRQLSKKLEVMGVCTVDRLAQMHPATVRKQFSVVLERTVRELN